MGKETIPLHRLAAGTTGVQVWPVSHHTIRQHLVKELTAAHRDDYYSCFFVEQGSGELFVDFQSVQMSAAALLVLPPGQIHQPGATLEFQGWVLLADAKLLSPHARTCFEQALAPVLLLRLSAAMQVWFRQLFQALHALDDGISALGTEVRQSLLNACLCQAARLLEAQENQQAQAYPGRGFALTKQFRQLVKQQFLTHKKPAAYAEQLHLTVSYLNDTVKAITGFSTSHFIQQEVLAEAQRLLFYTDLSIKEIAEQLGYADPKYFMRLFNKGTGTSPTAFRRSLPPRKSSA